MTIEKLTTDGDEQDGPRDPFQEIAAWLEGKDLDSPETLFARDREVMLRAEGGWMAFASSNLSEISESQRGILLKSLEDFESASKAVEVRHGAVDRTTIFPEFGSMVDRAIALQERESSHVVHHRLRTARAMVQVADALLRLLPDQPKRPL